MMAYINLTSEKQYVQRIDKFGGVDFTTNETQVPITRSPDAVNMIADEKFFPVKRAGYEKLHDYFEHIYGLFTTEDEIGKTLIVHSGDKLYAYGQEEALAVDMAKSASTAFLFGDALYILDGYKYRKVFRNSEGLFECMEVCSQAFVPTTSISRTPDGAGTAFEAVNLLTPKRINSFLGNGSSTLYQLDTGSIQEVTKVVADGTELTSDKYSVDVENGTVTFLSAPKDGNGVDNVIIHFTASSDGREDINRCSICGIYGGENDTRIFLSGNPMKPNVDWQSGLYDPTYFPDTGYTKIGSDASPIMGYVRHYDAQIIIKGSGADATQWLRTFMLDEELNPMFPVAQGANAAGAVSTRAFAVLGDLPLFLSEIGVHAVYGTSVDNQRNIRSISRAVDKRLCAEGDLKNALAVELAGKYYLFINDHVYIADSAQRYTDSQSSYQYEWYYWEGLPVTAAVAFDGRLYFGAHDGSLCRMKRREDVNAFNDNGAEYKAYWTTPMFELSTLYRTKTVRDVAFMLMPFAHGQYKIYYRSSKRDWELIKEGSTSLLDFNDIDFNDFSFSGLWVPEMSRTKRKERKAESFQLKVVNDTLDTSLGLLGLEIVFRQSARVK